MRVGRSEASDVPPDGVLNGVVLQTVAPPEAVLLTRERESEVVVDPYRLHKVTVAERTRWRTANAPSPR